MKILHHSLALLLFGSGLLLPAAFARAQDQPKPVDQARFMEQLLRQAEDEYRLFFAFKQPTKPHEFWAAMKFEIGVGKFELAALHLKLMLEAPMPEKVDQELVKIQQAIGYQPFLDLKKIQKWSDNAKFEDEAQSNVKLLLKRLTAAVETYLSAPERINRFIDRLDAPTPEERDYAFLQLKHLRERAVPYMVEKLRTEKGTPLRQRIVDAFLKLEPVVMPPLLEILKAVDAQDAEDMNLRPTVLELFRKRGDKRCVPYLWHLANAQIYPRMLRNDACDTLAYLTEGDPDRLPSAKATLAQMAERFYQHKAKIELGGKPLWRWDGQKLALQPEYLQRREAEEFFGLRYAREALDLDPAFEPAQIVMLNFILERTYDRDLENFFTKPMPPDIQKMLTKIDADLMMTVLERALDEYNYAVALPLVDMLGKRGVMRAAEPAIGYPTRGLTRSIFYPDRRVQFAAVFALVNMNYRPIPVSGIRVVEVLRRFLAAEPKSRVMFAMVPVEQKIKLRAQIKPANFEAFDIQTALPDVFEKLNRSADYDAIFIHPSVTTKDLPFILTQLRQDIDQGRLPLIVLAKEKNKLAWDKMVQRYANTWVVPESILDLPEELKRLTEEKIFLAGGAKLTVEERRTFTIVAMTLLWKMGRGEIAGYDVRPAQDTLRDEMRDPELAPKALETAARFPGREPQGWIAGVIFDPAQEKLQLQAVTLLHQHIEKNGFQLERFQIENLKDLQKKSAGNPELQNQIALVLSSLRVNPRQTGTRLQGTSPQPPGKKE